MVLRIVSVLVVAFVPTLAEAQSNRGERQRPPEQEARRSACREEARLVYGNKPDNSRLNRQQYVQSCMQRGR
jgi:competence protein ComGC